MGFEMTPESLKKLCRELKLYSSCPELNDVLHLQQKGIVKIKCLDKYTGLKTIYLECNAISLIEGLDHLRELRCLYLNQNLVEHVSGLENLRLLETLDLADNQIKTVRGLSECTALRQLNLSGNRIRSKADIEHLLECPSLASLDVSKNRIDDEEALKVVRSLQLNLLRMCGNPVLTRTWCYRKSTIACMPTLNYLDDSPVFEKERRLAYAWVEGGTEAEKAMREAIRQEEAEQRAYHHRAFQEMVQKAKADAAARQLQEEESAKRKRQEEEDKQKQEQEIVTDKSMDQDEIHRAPDISGTKRECSELNLDEDTTPAKWMKTSEEQRDTEDKTCCAPVVVAEDLMDVDNCPEGRPQQEHEEQQLQAPEEVQVSIKVHDADLLDRDEREQKLAEHRLKWADKEREFKKLLQDKLLERAAREVDASLAGRPFARPVIWGTKTYRELWSAAASIQQDEFINGEETDMEMEVDEVQAVDY